MTERDKRYRITSLGTRGSMPVVNSPDDPLNRYLSDKYKVTEEQEVVSDDAEG